MKEYKNNEELIDYLISKNVIVNDRELALKNIEKYSYYSIINGYKAVFKDENSNYNANTSFEEIFALYEFDKNIKAIFLKYTLEIEVIIKSLMSNTLAEEYGVEDYLKLENFDDNANEELVNVFIEKIEKEIDTNNMNLLNCEKEIITLENNIKSSFYGKRSLAEIEEDIINIDYQIDDFKKKLKAGELAREMMKKSYLEIRDDFGPELNEKLLKKYNAICNKEYNNILGSAGL